MIDESVIDESVIDESVIDDTTARSTARMAPGRMQERQNLIRNLRNHMGTEIARNKTTLILT